MSFLESPAQVRNSELKILRCSSCGSLLYSSRFSPSAAQGSRGFQYYCKQCTRDYYWRRNKLLISFSVDKTMSEVYRAEQKPWSELV